MGCEPRLTTCRRYSIQSTPSDTWRGHYDPASLTGDDLLLVNYVPDGKARLPRKLAKGLSWSGHNEPLTDGTYLATSVITNPDTLLSAHLANEEVWKRDPNAR